MAEKKERITYFNLRKEIESHKFRPIYVLHGEEPYYIDRLSECIVENALGDDERDFNLTICYGNDTTVTEVINHCKQYPAFAQRRVVVYREAQLAPKLPGHKNDLQLFQHYAKEPLKTTVLVICHKGGTMSAKPFTDMMRQRDTGVIFESARVRNDRDMAALVSTYCASKNVRIDNKSILMMVEFIGNDVSRMFGELDKLCLLVGGGSSGITPELIEKNIGLSKDFNNFELQDALRRRDALKAYQIVDYFQKNPKNNPVVMTVAMLFSLFSNALIIRATKDKSTESLLTATGMKSAWQLGKFKEAAANYSTQACVNIIGYLRELDVRSKGIDSRQDEYELLKELVYKILHS